MNETNNTNKNANQRWDELSNGSLLKVFLFISFFLLLSVAAVIAGIVIIFVTETILGGLILSFIGACATKALFTALKNNIKNIKGKMNYEQENGKKDLKKKIIKTSVLGGVIVVILCAAGITGFGIYEASPANSAAKRLVATEINEDSFEDIEKFENNYGKRNFLENIFFFYKDQVNEYKNKADEFAAAKASELEAEIDGIKPCNQINSTDEYTERKKLLDSLTLDINDAFEFAVKEKVANYQELEKHIADFEDLLQTYELRCDSCGGDGRKACSLCGGSGSRLVNHTTPNGKTWRVSQDCKTSVSCGNCGGDGKTYSFDTK
ncbi:MAG: hypothetical protein J6Q94_08830 [Clostridia bacterium]|nr:hypothetical protein [Clostridia bacterium]